MKNGERRGDKLKSWAYVKHCLAGEQGSVKSDIRCGEERAKGKEGGKWRGGAVEPVPTPLSTRLNRKAGGTMILGP